MPPPKKYMNWLPDWRDASAYPSESATSNHLAWELLRRNRHFQQECLKAVDSPTMQATLAKNWGLQLFKAFWESYTSHEELFVAGKRAASPPKGEPPTAFVMSSRLVGPHRLVLELNLQKLGQSTEKDDVSFLSLREAIQQHVHERSEKSSLRQRGVWTGKIGRHLRVVDAFSQVAAVSRQVIGKQFHEEGLILTEHQRAWSDNEILATAKAQYPRSDPKRVEAMIEAEKEVQADRRRDLAKRYSKEIGSQIERAFALVYENGYRSLAVTGIRPSGRRKTYSPSKTRKRAAGIFENARDYVTDAW